MSAEDEVGLPPTPDEDLLSGVGPTRRVQATGESERIAAIASEVARGFEALDGVHKAVSIFGSARTPESAPDYELARATARLLGEHGFTIITGGGPGIMEAANLGARDAGVLSVGLNIDLPVDQPTNPYVDLRLRFNHFFIRKLMFVRYASAFVVFPGGLGTLDEMFEALTLIQTGKVRHFPVVLMGVDFWSGLMAWGDQELLAGGKVDRADLGLLHTVDRPDGAVAIIEAGHRRQVGESAGIPSAGPAPQG